MNSSQRKLFLFGKYSLALLPPKKWLSELNIKKGDSVELKLDRSRRRIIINLGDPTSPNVAISKEDGVSDLKGSKRRKATKTDDWQSIPEL